MTKKATADRIVDAAIDLISEKGYKAATTRGIAELADVNEVTIFRQFGNKRGILKAIVQKFSYGPLLEKSIKENMVWNLEKDLFNISATYQDYLMTIKDFVLIGFREAGAFPEIDEEIANVPRHIKEELMHYFFEMKAQGKLTDVNIEATTMAFIALNFGFFLSRARLGNNVTQLSMHELLKTSVSIFSRGLTP